MTLWGHHLAAWMGHWELAVPPFVILFAMLVGLMLAGVAASLLALMRAKALLGTAEKLSRHSLDQCNTSIASMQQNLNGLAKQMHEVSQPVATTTVFTSKPGLNLTKRSQAIRMHRRGDSPEHIAKSLEIPLQEVDLLLKVHRIVIRTI